MAGDTRSALILMDFHHSVVADLGEKGRDAARQATFALRAARAAAIPVFHVVPHNRPGYPESPAGPPFDMIRAAGLFTEADIQGGIVEPLVPVPGEPVVAKTRYSPFRSNDLSAMLRVGGIDALVLAGIATSGVVLSAVRDAWDRDFAVTVLEDACADGDPALHAMLIHTLLPRQATILDVTTWCGKVTPGLTLR